MMAAKTSKTFSTGTLCLLATSSKGNLSWHVSATSTIRFGEVLRYVGWMRVAGGFTEFEVVGGPLASAIGGDEGRG